MEDVARWRLTGTVRTPSGALARGRVIAKLPISYTDQTTGVTVTSLEPVLGNVQQFVGELDLRLPNNKAVALTVIPDHSPPLYATVAPRSEDATVAVAVSAWSTEQTWQDGLSEWASTKLFNPLGIDVADIFEGV